MADLARGRLRNKILALQQALTGFVQPYHRFLLAQQLAHIDFLDEQIEELSAEIVRQLEAMSEPPSSSGSDAGTDASRSSSDGAEGEGPLTWIEATSLVDTVPGVNERAAEEILAEIGIDMSRFPTADHLASWSGRAPGNNESGGKRFSGRRPRGNKPLSSILTEVAQAAARTKGTFLNARYHRLAARRGKKRALAAISRSIIVSIWHILTYRQPYRELGGDYFDQRKKEIKVDYLVRRLEKLTGGTVSIELQPVAA
jgi:transposase